MLKRFRKLLWVVTLIGLVAVIAWGMMKMAESRTKLMETNLNTDLTRLREAVWRFHDDTGRFPAHLRDITAPANHPPTEGADGPIPAGSYAGPYMTTIPVSPLGRYEDFPGSVTMADEIIVPENWGYNPSNGKVIAISYEMGSDNAKYCSW